MGGEPLLCGVELGGTKCVCLAGTRDGSVLAQAALPTGSEPLVTLQRIADQLRDFAAMHGPCAALGIASFGPLELRRDAADYGRIGVTTKPGWSGCDLAGFFATRYGARLASSRTRARARAAPERGCLARELPLSRRLRRGAGGRSGDRGARGCAAREPGRRSPGVGAGRPRPGTAGPHPGGGDGAA